MPDPPWSRAGETMGSSKVRDPDGNAAQAFARIGAKRLVHRLIRYAMALGYGGPDALRCDAVEATDMAQALYTKGLARELVWNLRTDATEEEIFRYSCKKVKGMHSSRLARADVALSDGADGLDDLFDEDEDPEEAAFWTRQMAARRTALDGDTKAQQLLAAYGEGKLVREDAAKHLHWTPLEVTVVRQRMTRSLRRAGFKTTAESEDGPPSSGPQGRDDEPQATEERQGALREPARSAEHARRGR
jgi:hypothetical protein